MFSIIRVVILSFCLCLASAPYAMAAQKQSAPAGNQKVFKQVAEAYAAKNYNRVRQLLTPLAEKNDAHAAFALGLMAARGEGQEVDIPAAEKWWSKASDAGNPQAQFNLGYLYFKGAIGDKPDLAKARELWGKAAKQKHPDALFGIGIMQSNGAGGERDLEGAVKSFTAAANAGHPMAEYELGQAYMEGRGVPEDKKKGMQFLQKAASKGLPEARQAVLELGGEIPPPPKRQAQAAPPKKQAPPPKRQAPPPKPRPAAPAPKPAESGIKWGTLPNN